MDQDPYVLGAAPNKRHLCMKELLVQQEQGDMDRGRQNK